MIDHQRCYFGLLRDWLYFCTQVQDAAEADFTRGLIEEAQSPDPKWEQEGAPGPEELELDRIRVDEIQRAVRLLATALNTHAEGVELANLWLDWCGNGRWRLMRTGREQAGGRKSGL
jgi:hypothetical protein